MKMGCRHIHMHSSSSRGKKWLTDGIDVSCGPCVLKVCLGSGMAYIKKAEKSKL